MISIPSFCTYLLTSTMKTFPKPDVRVTENIENECLKVHYMHFQTFILINMCLFMR